MTNICLSISEAYDAACRANEQKFVHDPKSSALREKLLPFINHELVYASPTDNHFGIGFSAEEAGDPDDKRNRRRWGRNRFGSSLLYAQKHLWELANPEAVEAISAKIRKGYDAPGGVYW